MTRALFRTVSFLLTGLLLCIVPTWVGAEQSGDGSSPRTLTVYYTNDMHGHIKAGPETVGLARIATLVKSDPHALLLDAGDYLHGTPFATRSQGEDIIRLMKRTGYFAAAAGNHEFDYHPGVLRARMREAATGPDAMHILSANVRTGEGTLLFEPDAETTLDGIRLCVFGLTTPNTPILTFPPNVEGLSFTDPLAAAEDEVRRLRGRGCEVVIALAHLGLDAHIEITSADIAGRVPGIDAVIDGHSHRVLDERMPNGALVVSAGAHGSHLGRLRITYDAGKKAVTAVTNAALSPEDCADAIPDFSISSAIELLDRELDFELSTIVGHSELPLRGEERLVRTRDMPLGRLCADAIRAAYGDPIALINSGAIRGSLPTGGLTRRDVAGILPYDDPIVSLQVSGRELRDILEHGFSRLPGADGAFPQVSGLIVRVNSANPPGGRVLSVSLADGSPLAPGEIYALSINGFMAGGGDGYPHLSKKPRRKSFIMMNAALRRFLRDADTAAYTEDAPPRIVFTDETE